MSNKICKIVYFDEESVTDYVQIVAGGEMETTTELLKGHSSKGEAKAGAKASVGLGSIFKILTGLNATADGDAFLGASFNSEKMVKNIVKNTMLTDFLNVLDGQQSNNKRAKATKGCIKKFDGYTISAEKDSLSYIVMVSPYLSMLKDASVPAGEFNIAIDQIEHVLKNAKGYYEFVGTKGKSKVVLRFNINSFKNGYKISDLLKMNLSIYAIKVGKTTLDMLNVNKELGMNVSVLPKDNPSYVDEDIKENNNDSKKVLDVYDVLLAGVEADDR